MKSIKKLLSFVLAIALMVGMMPAMVLADEVTPAGQVRVIVANDTYVGENEDGETAAWTGTLVDTIVEINSKSTMMSAVVDALTSKGFTQVGAESNYIEEINGLAAFDGGFMSGWMTTLNDWFVDEGAGNFTVANGSLVDGDVIRFMYTLDYGADLGGSWDNQSTQLKALAVDGAQIEFAPDKYNYELEVPAEADAIRINSEAANKNFQVRKYSSVATEDSLRCTADAYALATNPSKAKFNSGYTGDQALPLAASGNTIIKVVCGDPAWPSMNSSAGASVYTITVKKPVPVTEADVTIRSQAVNNYMNGFDEPVTVKSDLAESYGYTAAIPAQVSALDVLVKAHEQVFGQDFTAETAGEYPVVKDGSSKALFGEVTG
ncbi:MAG: DUF4430 domain-containing protein, partial [Lachnospiraceae bacterium]|nr:DUF4430 domain-containing protein [Candidatus Equihabitans merdae]